MANAFYVSYINTELSRQRNSSHFSLEKVENSSNKKMTGFSLTHHHKSSHVRSSSDPQFPHPILLRIAEELHDLRASSSSSSSSSSSCSANSHVVSCALTKLCCLYMSIDELFCLTQNQKAINHQRNEKWVEEQLDDSIQLLDLISALRECVALIREHIQDIHFSLRRKDEPSCVVSEKTLMKRIKHCSKMLRHYSDNDHKSSVFSGDQDLIMAERVMVETREIVNSLFKSMLGFLLMPSLKMKVNKISNWGRTKCWKLEGSELKELEESTEELEKGLEQLFKRLIHNRVSLLNILSL